MDVIPYINHPLRINGFDSVFCMHFIQFIEWEQEKIPPEQKEYFELQQKMNNKNYQISGDELKRFCELEEKFKE